MLPGMGMVGKGNAISVNIAINASQNNINLFTLAGSPTDAGAYTFTVGAGVVIGSTTTGSAAITTGVFPAGSVVTLFTRATYGKEGAGGAANVAGSAGGPAISLGYALSIDNTNGFIFGGGGGGGGGVTNSGTDGNDNPYSGIGGSGGSGRGFGNQSAAGSGQAGTSTPPPDGGGSPTLTGSTGGNGGDWGTAGSAGASGGGSGGAAGKAVALNGFTVTWLAGNDSTHVKGAVS